MEPLIAGLLIILFSVLIFIGNFTESKRDILCSTFPVSWSEVLQKTRLWLEDGMAQMNNAGNFTRQTGMLNYLMSSINPKIINAIMRENAGNSLYRPVDIRYLPHEGTGNLITTDSSGNCNRVAQRRDQIQTLQPTLYAEHKFTIDEDYVRENAQGVGLQDRLNNQVQSSMRIVRESISRQLFAKEAALFGANPAQSVGAGNFTTVTMTIASSGKIDDNFFDQITTDKEDNFMGSAEVAIIGKGNARKYMNRLAVGNANDAGIDYREVARDFGMVLFKDDDAASVLSGANNALVIYPGNTQFFQYNLFRGSDFIQDFGDRIKGTLPDPVFPEINYDYILEYDKNCTTGNGLQGAWVGRILTYFDIWNVNEDAYGDVYSDINDFNGVLGYTFNES